MLLELLAAQAATASDALMSEDVFASTLYTGNATVRTIATGVDLSGAGDGTLMQGGLVWIKSRSATGSNNIFDTLRGTNNALFTDSTIAQTALFNSLMAFSGTALFLGTGTQCNANSTTYAAWTFRRAKKFMDVVTWTGNGAANRQIAHALGGPVGVVITKATSTTGSWNTYHRSATGDLVLEATAAQTASRAIINGASDTTFTVSGVANTNGVSYVGYVFGHDDTADGIVQCGSFTTDASGNATVGLGWEPGWLLVKRTSSAADWQIADEARGWTADTGYQTLVPNTTAAETASTGAFLRRNATGFTANGVAASATYVYMAIRRGPMRVPTTGASVFSVAAGTGTTTAVDPADMHLARFQRTTTANTWIADRLRGFGATGSPLIKTNLTDAEATPTTAPMVTRTENGAGGPVVNLTLSTASAAFVHYAWKRAPGFFDTVCWAGDSVTGRLLKHNLNAAPTMMWFKSRGNAADWRVYHSALGATQALDLRSTAAAFTDTYLNSTLPTSTSITVNGGSSVNSSASSGYVAYLFGDVPGVSKAGSYTGSASAVTVDCGFSPRFVLIKRTDTTGNWTLADTARGIVAAADPYILLNSTAAEVTASDWIDPVAGGFVVNTGLADVNAAGGTFCFYAIA